MFILAIISILAIKTTYGGDCGYYANYPINTCLQGSQYSNYYYCNDSNFLYWKQYGASSDCLDTETSDTPLCDPDNADCFGSCGSGQTCEYVSYKSYGNTGCNKTTDDYSTVAYIMDYCHPTSAASIKYECSAVGQLTFTLYIDESCTTVGSTYTYTVDNTPATECLDAAIVSNQCSETITPFQSNIGCPEHANRPLEVCYGNYDSDPNGVSYSNYFYCNNWFLFWKQYANTDCSGDPAYDSKQCNSRFSTCPVSMCDASKCSRYFVQKNYGSNNCNKATDSWTEVTYPVGYCVDLSTTSLKLECNNDGSMTYFSYSNTGCQTLSTSHEILLTGNPTVIDAGCLVTTIYATCTTGSPTTSPLNEHTLMPSVSPTDSPEKTPTASPEEVRDQSGASGCNYIVFVVMVIWVYYV